MNLTFENQIFNFNNEIHLPYNLNWNTKMNLIHCERKEKKKENSLSLYIYIFLKISTSTRNTRRIEEYIRCYNRIKIAVLFSSQTSSLTLNAEWNTGKEIEWIQRGIESNKRTSSRTHSPISRYARLLLPSPRVFNTKEGIGGGFIDIA